MVDKIKEFKELKKSHEISDELAKKQHDKGRLTAKERIDLLMDKDSFMETDEFVQLRSTNFDLSSKKVDGDGNLNRLKRSLTKFWPASEVDTLQAAWVLLEAGYHD